MKKKKNTKQQNLQRTESVLDSMRLQVTVKKKEEEKRL